MKLKFRITGMTCAACSARVEKVTSQVPGVRKAEVNLLAGTMQVEADSQDAAQAIMTAVDRAGYHAEPAGAAPKQPRENPADATLREMKVRIIGSAVSLVVLMYFTMGHMLHLPMPGGIDVFYHGTHASSAHAQLVLGAGKCPGCGAGAVFPDPAAGISEPSLLQPRLESLVAPCSQYGLADCGGVPGCPGCGAGAVFPDPAAGISEPSLLQPRLESLVAPCSQYGLADCGGVPGCADLWCSGYVPYGLGLGTRGLGRS